MVAPTISAVIDVGASVMSTKHAAIFSFSLLTSGCAIFPRDAHQAAVTVQDVKASIECELAAVLADPNFQFDKAGFRRWNVVADLDLTLVRTLGADGKAGITAPYTIAQVSATPSAGLSGVDTTIAHMQIGMKAGQAANQHGPECTGPNPSETGMGLATWLGANLTTMPNDAISGITYTTQFQVVGSAGARFGYTLVPVNNTVAADAGISSSYDQTHRLSVAIAPPSPPPDPIPVYYQQPKPKPKPSERAGSERSLAPATRNQQKRPDPTVSGAREARDPAIQYLLGRKSPITLSR